MNEEFDIRADLSIRVEKALGNLNRVSAASASLGRRLQSAGEAGVSAMGRMARVGVAVAGFALLGGAIRLATSNIFEFEAASESAQISIATVLQIGGRAESFAEAMGLAADSYDRLRVMAVQSPATTFDLVNIFQGVLAFGQAGVALEDMERLTARVAVAAGALGVDFDQAQRDIAAMASGVAGTDVKLFRMLRTSGALTQTTQEWNALVASDAPRAFMVLQEALSKFDDASVEVGNSWAGVTSTLQDVGQVLGATARGPVFNRLKSALRNVAQAAIDNFTQLNAVFERIGAAALRFLNPAITFIENGIVNLIENADQIPAKFDAIRARAAAIADTLAKVIAVKFAVSMAMMTGGAALSAAPALTSGITALGGAAVSAGTGLVNLFANFAPIMIRLMTVTATFLGGGAVMSTLLAGLASAAAFIVPILIALVAVVVAMAIPATLLGSALYVLLTDFDTVVVWFNTNIVPSLRQAWAQIQAILDQAGPDLRAFGEVGLYLLGEAVKDVANVVKAAVEVFVGMLPRIRSAMEAMGMGALFAAANAQFTVARNLAGASASRDAALAALGGGNENPADAAGGASRRAGGGRSSVNNDFRGSRINIHQEFRQQDPDRIAVATLGALSSAGERRIASGYAPAVTR